MSFWSRFRRKPRQSTVQGVAGPEAGTPGGLPGAIRAEASWGLSHEVDIHYAQTRPIDGLTVSHKLPLSTDCSGFVTLCYKWAGAPDPNGRGYDGYGYTGTLLSYMKQIQQSQAQVGDLVMWADAERTRHVAMVIEAGSDPLLVSHGSEPGPIQIRFSSENRYFQNTLGPACRVYWLTLPSGDARMLRAPSLAREPFMPLMESDPPMEGRS